MDSSTSTPPFFSFPFFLSPTFWSHITEIMMWQANSLLIMKWWGSSCSNLLCKLSTRLTEICRELAPVIMLTNNLADLANRTVLIYLFCFTRNTFSVCLSGSAAHTLNKPGGLRHLKGCHWLSLSLLPVLSREGRECQDSCRVITISTPVQATSPYGTPHNFAATETNSHFLIMPRMNCAYHILNFKALKIAASHKQTYLAGFFFFFLKTCPWTNLLLLSLQAFVITEFCSFCLQFRIMWSSKTLPLGWRFFFLNL